MDLQPMIAIIAALSGIILGWWARARDMKKQIEQDTQEETEAAVSLRSDMDYIKRGVDEIRVDLRSQGQRMDVLAERVTRIEESAKQAHKRIDEIAKCKGV